MGDHHHPSSSWRDGVMLWSGPESSQGAREGLDRGEGGKQVCRVNENGELQDHKRWKCPCRS